MTSNGDDPPVTPGSTGIPKAPKVPKVPATPATPKNSKRYHVPCNDKNHAKDAHDFKLPNLDNNFVVSLRFQRFLESQANRKQYIPKCAIKCPFCHHKPGGISGKFWIPIGFYGSGILIMTEASTCAASTIRKHIKNMHVNVSDSGISRFQDSNISTVS